MKYLMWDVDGTLILTGGAGKDAMINVIKDYYFLDAFDFTRSLAGRTDSDIIKAVVTRLRGRCSSAEAAGLLIRYHMELPKQLPLHKGRILKNVEKTRRKKRQMWITLNLQLRKRQIQENRHGLVSAS